MLLLTPQSTTLDQIWQSFTDTANSTYKKAAVFDYYSLVKILQAEIENLTYQPRAYNCFVVKDPKAREIFAPHLIDRIAHRYFVTNFQHIGKDYIFHHFANRSGKGVWQAVTAMQKMLRHFSANAYYLQCDIHSFFMSIDKNILWDIFIARVHKSMTSPVSAFTDEQKMQLHLAQKIIFHDPTNNPCFTGNAHLLPTIPRHKSLFYQEKDMGLPLGNYTSQFFSALYLNELDQFVKHQLKIKYYLRYVDDIIILHDDPKVLNSYYDQINLFLLERLKLKLHPKKKKMQKIKMGLDFLGFIIYPHHLTIRPRNISSLKRKLYFFNYLLAPKDFPYPNYPETLVSYHQYSRGDIIAGALPSVSLLNHMLQVINAYYGMYIKGKTYNLRTTLFHKNFHNLKKYFYPVKSFSYFKPIPHRTLKKRRLVA